MTDHPGENRTDGTDIAGAAPVRKGGRGLTVALAGLIVLVVGGGWAYDHRVEYATAYRQLFKGASAACPASGGSCSASAVAEAPGCCHAGGGCAAPHAVALRAPVEAPKPADVVAEQGALPSTDVAL
jgi:hypothetical protein